MKNRRYRISSVSRVGGGGISGSQTVYKNMRCNNRVIKGTARVLAYYTSMIGRERGVSGLKYETLLFNRIKKYNIVE